MYSGVTGLRSYQSMMDIVGNNIANSNTVGFKSSQVVFQDRLSQLLQGAGLPEGDQGGTNPSSVGLGVRLAATPTVFAQGGLQVTGKQTDLSIQGDGFFAVTIGGETVFTRAGAFSFDSEGRLVSPQGGVVQGWLADATGDINTTLPIESLQMPLGQVIPPVETESMVLGGNLPADVADGTTISASTTIYDAQGTAFRLTLEWERDVASDVAGVSNAWQVTSYLDGTAFGAVQQVDFTIADGLPTITDYDTGDPAAVAGEWDGDGVNIDLDAATQFSGPSSLTALSQDGAAVGFLQSFSISQEGLITGVFSNGKTQALGQVALVNFNNPAGLEKVDGSNYRITVNSGLPQIGEAGTGGRGLLAAGTLEMSNVDLANEFTALIIAQRGFQANSRIISASDELLQDLVNLKR
jgi:flagellar hook protein FlgE